MKFLTKKWSLLIVSGVVFCAVLFGAAVVNGNRQDRLAEQSGRISELSNRKATLTAAYDQKDDEAMYIASGLDMTRIAQDDLAATKLIKRVCTWDSKETYDAMRNGVMQDYKLSKDSSFVKVFIPDVKNVDVGGKQINEIDANGLNMEFINMESHVTGISGDAYTYLTLVTIQSSDKVGATADGQSVFIYTVDGKGNLTDLNAYNIGAQ